MKHYSFFQFSFIQDGLFHPISFFFIICKKVYGVAIREEFEFSYVLTKHNVSWKTMSNNDTCNLCFDSLREHLMLLLILSLERYSMFSGIHLDLVYYRANKVWLRI